SSKKRAALHVVDAAGLSAMDRGGVEPLEVTVRQFAAALRSENHTLKRSLTDPRLFSGIGNAYSDEILHRAQLSPVALTSRLGDEEIGRLRQATRDILNQWTDLLRAESKSEFPENVTALRSDFAV